MRNYKLAIIGGGVMGKAILANLLDNNIFKFNQIIISDLSAKNRNRLKKRFKVKTTASNLEIINSEIILLAVKPQHAKTVFKDLKGRLKDQTVISIMAGISLDSLKKGLGANNIVRSMPNTPAQIGLGMIVWKKIGKVNIKLVKKIFNSLGEEIEVKNERLINSATAISGSGPAYVFDFIDILTKNAKEFGFTADQSRKLVEQMFKGAIAMLQKTNKTANELKKAVTSKGGTTEEALRIIKKEKIEQKYNLAISACQKKAEKISKNYG